jgi:hypothetical protein
MSGAGRKYIYFEFLIPFHPTGAAFGLAAVGIEAAHRHASRAFDSSLLLCMD